ncbi:MAG: hypothetical protein ABIP48_20820 [Planctomycetota bacterium]
MKRTKYLIHISTSSNSDTLPFSCRRYGGIVPNRPFARMPPYRRQLNGKVLAHAALILMRRTEENQQRPDALLCTNDNVSVSAEDPKCLHPSSLCRFRDFCEVLEAARKKKRSEARHEQEERKDERSR